MKTTNKTEVAAIGCRKIGCGIMMLPIAIISILFIIALLGAL